MPYLKPKKPKAPPVNRPRGGPGGRATPGVRRPKSAPLNRPIAGPGGTAPKMPTPQRPPGQSRVGPGGTAPRKPTTARPPGQSRVGVTGKPKPRKSVPVPRQPKKGTKYPEKKKAASPPKGKGPNIVRNTAARVASRKTAPSLAGKVTSRGASHARKNMAAIAKKKGRPLTARERQMVAKRSTERTAARVNKRNKVNVIQPKKKKKK